MVNDENMKKIHDMMISTQLVYLRGQLRNIQRCVNEANEVYYLADLRVLKGNLDVEKFNDFYSLSYSIVNVCFSSEFVSSNSVNDETMKNFKNNEVLLNLSLNCSIKKFKTEDKIYKNNNVKFYVNDIMLLNNISKPQYGVNI